MANPYFQFKQFTVHHDRSAMKVTTDSCFFGAWTATEIQNSKSGIKNVLDIGAGTGLLSLMVVQKNAVTIDAVEIDADAARQARKNIDASRWADRIQVFNEDIVSFHSNKKYDCIICNPPFYENELTSTHSGRNRAHHSSHLTISQTLNSIKENLKENGLFFLMYPVKREKEISRLLIENELYPIRSVSLKQSPKHLPFRMILMGTNVPVSSGNQLVLAIWNENQEYTSEFKSLLKDYYLYL